MVKAVQSAAVLELRNRQKIVDLHPILFCIIVHLSSIFTKGRISDLYMNHHSESSDTFVTLFVNMRSRDKSFRGLAFLTVPCLSNTFKLFTGK